MRMRRKILSLYLSVQWGEINLFSPLLKTIGTITTSSSTVILGNIEQRSDNAQINWILAGLLSACGHNAQTKNI